MKDARLQSWVTEHVQGDQRLLVMAPPGVVAAVPIAVMADAIVERRGACCVLVADPGDADIGVPASVVLAERSGGMWTVQGLEGLATLDGARFRGPLMVAVFHLVAMSPKAPLLILMPGLVRGVAAFELPAMLAKACEADAALVADTPQTRRLAPHFRAMRVPLHWLDGMKGPRTTDRARRDGRRKRWAEYLHEASPMTLDLRHVVVMGLPLPADVPHTWEGRVVALLDDQGQTLCMAQVRARERHELHVVAPPVPSELVRGLCVRDAGVDASGAMVTLEAPEGLAAQETKRARARPAGRAFDLPVIGEGEASLEIPPLGRKGEIVCDLVNGVFGDPLLHVRLVAKKRSLLLDIGDAGKLPRRIAHQVSNVFVSHAHMDHVAGLVWLVRMRMGDNGFCHLVGPPGLAEQLASQLGVFTWNLLEREGPGFIVDEVHGRLARRFRLQAGQPIARQPIARQEESRHLDEGVVLRDRDVTVRVATADHNTPVIAYRVEHAGRMLVRKSKLRDFGLATGPWIGGLQRDAESGELEGAAVFPDGRSYDKRLLASELLRWERGHVLSYVTDVADSVSNFEVLRPLVAGSDILVCEAGFIDEDRERAVASAHLTAAACARLACEGGVKTLVPSHFSARYESCPERVYEEVARGFDGVIVTSGANE